MAGANTVSKAYERRPLNACFGHKLTLFLAEWSSISSWVQIDPFSLVNGLYSWCAPHLPRGRINSLWWPLSLTLSHHRFSHQIKTRIKSQFNHQMWLADFKTKADSFCFRSDEMEDCQFYVYEVYTVVLFTPSAKIPSKTSVKKTYWWKACYQPQYGIPDNAFYCTLALLAAN